MISVVLCTYNGEKYINEQLHSILNQSLNVDEIIICDDGSTDNTIQIIKKFQNNYSHINVFINEKTVGVTKNFEKALMLCKGDIIFLSDQDDIWNTKKVEKICKKLNANKDNLLVFSNAVLVDKNGDSIGMTLWDTIGLNKKNNYSIADFLGKRFITGATCAIKKDLIQYSIPIPDVWIHDAWLAINAQTYGNVVSLDENLIAYRQHENNVIGARKRNVVAQVKYTLKNIEKSRKFRTTMKERFLSLLLQKGDMFKSDDKIEVEKCLSFWSTSEMLLSGGFFKGIGIIINNLVHGRYHKYNNGFYGAGVDFVILCQTFINAKR